MKLNTLNDLLVYGLRDIYYAEKRIQKALARFAEHAASEELKRALTEHGTETCEHIRRLEQIFDELGVSQRAQPCEAIDGIIRESEKFLKSRMGPLVMDAGLIATAQRIEHYELAAYGCVRAFAEKLGYRSVVEVLALTLEEESGADTRLTEIAEAGVNESAVA